MTTEGKNVKLRILDLFSGIGGFSLGLESTGGFETVAFCEFDKAAQKVLKLRWPNVPIFEDIRGLNDTVKEDIITGGFPCQPFSVAGKRAGTEDNRYLWPELLRVIRLVKPTWCILENVRGLLSIEEGLVFENCLLDLEAAGYEHQTLVIPACAVNAQHRRDRVWIICHANNSRSGQRLQTERIRQTDDEGRAEQPQFEFSKTSENVDYANSTQCERGRVSSGVREEKSNISSRSKCRDASENVADTTSIGRQGQRESVQRSNNKKERERQTDNVESISQPRIRRTESRLGGEFDGISSWLDESGLPKISSGVPKRANRLKQLGNSIVPQIAAAIGYAILEI
jgi:DNA (cytosine-5)-methyltransferase 1